MRGSHVIFGCLDLEVAIVHPYSQLSIYQIHIKSRRSAASHQNL